MLKEEYTCKILVLEVEHASRYKECSSLAAHPRLQQLDTEETLEKDQDKLDVQSAGLEKMPQDPAQRHSWNLGASSSPEPELSMSPRKMNTPCMPLL